MATHPPNPCLFHPLPRAPEFLGRALELESLYGFWRGGLGGVLGLVGLGGAGKTAVAARFLDDLLARTDGPRPQGLFVWSFYQQPDPELFLEEAYRYFAADRAYAGTARGSGLVHLLQEALAMGGPHLIILDGLERVQSQDSSDFGRIEDPLLRGLLLRLAEGGARTTVLVTTRFPLSDLAAFQDRGYRHLEIGGLDRAAAQALLRQRGVRGEDAVLAALIDSYGAHALTLDHLGGVIGQFLEGDALRAPEAPALASAGMDRQALRLARLLRAYEEHLPATELALLCRLCLVRRSLTQEQIAGLFLSSPAVHARSIRELHNLIARLPTVENKLAPDPEDLAQAVGDYLEEALAASPIAGPEEHFRREVLAAAQWSLAMPQAVDHGAVFDELAHLYADVDLEVQTDLRPLSAHDRRMLRESAARYVELRSQIAPPTPKGENEGPFKAFQARWGLSRERRELRPDDLHFDFRRVHRRLWHLACKHRLLRRVRDLTCSHQRKWTLAGPLAHLERTELGALLEALVGRHLAVREADGSFSIHPAVRDHFHRLAIAGQQSGWHDVLRETMVSLVQQPGVRLPESPAALDLAEEAVYHALQGGRPQEAEVIFRDVLGGLRHLGWKLGEMSRGHRILRGFDSCPDRSALAWFLRALGEFKEAHDLHPLPHFRADVLLLRGRLTAVAAEGDSVRTATAEFLMGQTTELPPGVLGCAVPRSQLMLLLQRLNVGSYTEGLEEWYGESGLESDLSRCQLILAEAAMTLGNQSSCRQFLDAATPWILHSGSVEHLCLLQLTQARAARLAGDLAVARRAMEEGLHLANRCGLGLYQVELMCEQGEQLLASGDARNAAKTARAAVMRAGRADCQYLWGVARAGHLLGQARLAQGNTRGARTILRKTLDLRDRIGDPRAEQTEQLLGEV